jgi:hypothetical protein
MKRTPFKSTRKPMRKRSGKTKGRKSASGDLVDPDYLNAVRARPCIACGCAGPSDPHHCKDRPPADASPYVYFPGFGETSADRDAIPLCRADHDLYHRHKGEFHKRYGKDYTFIAHTRAAIYGA